MKKFYCSIIICILINTVMEAQPCGFSSFSNSGVVVQSIPGSNVVTPAVTMGKYLLVNVYQGRNYTFSMCGLAGQFDAVMTIYQNASGTLIGYDDDFCGGGLGSGSLSQVNFVSPITGYVRVVLTQYPCVVSSNSCAVRIIDNSPVAAPTITCPSNITVPATAGQCGANINYASATATGNPVPTITYSHASGSFFPIGTTTVTATASNGVNPNATCTFTITVNGGTDTDNDGTPNICDSDDDNDGVFDTDDCAPLDNTKWQQALLYIDSDNDNYTNGQQTVCYGATIPIGYKASSLGSDCNDNNSAIHPGATEVCNDIDDDCDGVVDDGFINTVVTCPFTGTVTRNLAAGCTYTVNGNEFNATVTQNCGPLGYSLTGATTGTGASLAGVQLNTGTTTVTWAATNANDQSFTCSFNVYVVPVPAAITCPANIIVRASNGQCGAVVNYTTPTLPNLCANNDDLLPTTITFNYSGQIVDWIVPPGITSITIESKGAEGGSTSPIIYSPGLGAHIKGVFSVTPGQKLKILVGQKPNGLGNGGGGTFVVKEDPTSSYVMSNGIKVTPLIIAGGGGGGVGFSFGASSQQDNAFKHGQSTTSGGSSTIYAGGVNGNGGTTGGTSCKPAGGGGFLSGGQNGECSANGGNSFLSGGAGGTSFDGFTAGFGGGGGGINGHRGGGGGGYSGGGAGIPPTGFTPGGGGGSFNTGTSQVNLSGVNVGHGSVKIIFGTEQSSISQTAGLPSGSNFPIGTTTNTFVMTDAFGQTNTCSFTVTVNDEQAPSVTQPNNITVANAIGQCSASVNFSAIATDNCSVTSLKYYLYYNTPNQEEISFPKTFAVGSHTVTVVAKDAANNTTTKAFTITVDDTEKPTVTNGTIGSCYTSVAAAEAAAFEATTYSDNCSSFEELDVNVATVGTCSALITVTVTDASNNSRSVTYNAKIDNIAPVLSLTPASVTENCQSVPPVPTVTASDNCDGSVNVTFTPTSTQGSDPAQSNYYNYTITRKWSATDGCGNTVEHVQIITVQDVTPPGLTCPANIVVSNETGLCSAQVTFNATSSDLCSTPTVKYYLYYGTAEQQEISSPWTFAVGAHTLKVVSTDPSGNSNNCTFTITVNDTEKPNVTKGTIASCYKTVASAQAAALAATTYSDNCTPNAQLNVNVATVGTCSAVITVTVTDAANNWSSVTYNTRIDNTSPVLSLTPAGVTVSCQSVPPVPTVTASDNCDGSVNVSFTTSNTQGSDPSQSNYYNYSITRKWYATDGCGNTVEHVQTITVQDITDPVIACPADKLSVPFDFGQLYATIAIGTATASDNCADASNITIAGTRSDNVVITNQQYPLGQTTVAWSATDPTSNSDECTQTITVRKRNTAVTYTGDMTDSKICVQYSDIINLQAKLIDNEGLPINNISGRTITFQLLSGTTVLRSKTATTNSSGVAVDSFKIEQAPGIYSVKTIFAGDAYFNGSNDQDNCEVKQEDADVEYNGSQYFTTSSATTLGGSVTLAASVNDIDDGSDKRGDIRKAKATFRDGGPAGNVLGSANLTVGLVTPGTLTNGLSATTQSYTLNSNEAGSGGKIFQVWVGANDHYKGADAGPTPVTLALPGLDFVTGGGHLVVTNSAGTYAGTLNSKMNFGFTMKWNKSGKSLQGNINIVFRKWQLYNGVWQWRVYQVKSNAINSMAVVEVGTNGQPVSGTNPAAFRKAIINTKANLKDVTDPLNNIDLGGNHNLTLDAWDHITANGGVSDKISVTLMGATTNELLFSSSWISNATAAQTITGGNINVRNGSSGSSTSINTMTKSNQMEAIVKDDLFIIKVYPNPTNHQFALTINSNLKETIVIQLYDAAGRKIQTMNATANETIRFGEKLRAGIYIAEIMQGTKRETAKLIKQ